MLKEFMDRLICAIIAIGLDLYIVEHFDSVDFSGTNGMALGFISFFAIFGLYKNFFD